MKKWSSEILNVGLVLLICVMANVAASYVHGSLDLTEEKRFTMTQETRDLVSSLDEDIYIKVYLDGKFPAGFKRLKNETSDILRRLRSMSSRIEYEFFDPSTGSVSEVNGFRKEMAKDGIIPVQLTFRENDELTQKYIYPFAMLHRGDRKIPVNLLEEQLPGDDEEVVLNESIQLLEYKFASAIQKLVKKNKPNVVFTEGHGELENRQIAKLRSLLRSQYDTGRINLDSIHSIHHEIDLMVVAKPRTSFTLKDQFKIDQYIMNGGKVIWFLDVLDVSNDSININKFYVPEPLPLDLNDMLFKYGVRIQPNAILDLECSQILQVVGMNGNQPQTELFNWYYHPLVAPSGDHVITRNLDRINTIFPSTIDTIKTKTKVDKTVLLASSVYSRYQITPMRLNFEILRYEPVTSKFDKGPQNVAVLLEGEFESFFKNRVPDGMKSTLQEIGQSFKEKSLHTSQLVISDGDMVKNIYNSRDNSPYPIGYNKWEQKLYKANEDFILNAIEYMIDDNGILASRAKEVKLRMLDKVKASSQNLMWQVINILLPLLILAIFGVLFNILRKKKYGMIRS